MARNPNDVPGGDYWVGQSRFERALNRIAEEAGCGTCRAQGWYSGTNPDQPIRCPECNPEPKPGIIPEFHWIRRYLELSESRVWILVRESDMRLLYRLYENNEGWVAYNRLKPEELGTFETEEQAKAAVEKAFKTDPENIRMQRQWREQHTKS